jgi:hypothetical protein
MLKTSGDLAVQPTAPPNTLAGTPVLVSPHWCALHHLTCEMQRGLPAASRTLKHAAAPLAVAHGCLLVSATHSQLALLDSAPAPTGVSLPVTLSSPAAAMLLAGRCFHEQKPLVLQAASSTSSEHSSTAGRHEVDAVQLAAALHAAASLPRAQQVSVGSVHLLVTHLAGRQAAAASTLFSQRKFGTADSSRPWTQGI